VILKQRQKAVIYVRVEKRLIVEDILKIMCMEKNNETKWRKDVLPHNVHTADIHVTINPNASLMVSPPCQKHFVAG
jgi:murein endopeptidase